MDKPIPWILLLIGIAMFEGAIDEYRENKPRGAILFLAFALLFFASTVISAGATNPKALLLFLHAPKLLLYAFIAVPISLIAGFAWLRYRGTQWNIRAFLRPTLINLGICDRRLACVVYH
jgi:predicted MFS family arabinose efflux permease